MPESYTAVEQEAFVWLQSRMIKLLMQQDVIRFEQLFHQRQGLPTSLGDPRLEPYRNLAVLYFLRTELFDHIIPRIRNRLSSAAPRHLKRELLPTRGKIDWNRTAAFSWRERPGELPLEVYAAHRRRDFANPENLLVVATLIQYQETARQILKSYVEEGTATPAVRHPLTEIVEKCKHELAFLQFTVLSGEAREILEGRNARSMEDLEKETRSNILPGSNSAYSALLNWRYKLEALKLLDRSRPSAKNKMAITMLGADPARDNYLYQAWIFYELCDLLQRERRLVSVNYGTMVVRFRWGEPGQDECEYALQHDRQLHGAEASLPTDLHRRVLHPWQGSNTKVPLVRPDFYMWRCEPASQSVEYEGKVIWHEPGYLLDAKYYRPRSSESHESLPVKRMLADLQLTNERYGALFFAFERQVTASEDETPNETDTPEQNEYVETASESSESAAATSSTTTTTTQPRTIRPRPEMAQYIQPDLEIDKWLVPPRVGLEMDSIWKQILNGVHERLKTRIELACHGIFLDSMSANAQGHSTNLLNLPRRTATNSATVAAPDDLLLCPKPHVAPWRMDIVSLSEDCYRVEADGAIKASMLCHIRNQSGKHPPSRLTTLDQVREAFAPSNTDDPASDDAIEAATRAALATVQRYADLIKPDLTRHRKQLCDLVAIGDDFNTTNLLTSQQRKTLVLAHFLWKQLEDANSENYAGAALLFCGILEQLARETIYKFSPITNPSYHPFVKEKERTLGRIINYRAHIEPAIDSIHWQANTTSILTLGDWIKKSSEIAPLRNRAAHEAELTESEFEKLKELYFGGTGIGYGMFNSLLKAWK